MKTSRIALIAGGLLLAVAGPALAQPRGGFAAGEAFARADTNNDNRVSRDESVAWLGARFAEVDANRDGGVTIEEFRAWAQARMGNRQPPAEMRERAEQRGQGMFRMLDANSDGRVTLDEARPFLEAMFRARDTDSDGFLSREEVTARRGGGMRGHGHHHGMGGYGPGRGPGAQPAPTQQN